MKISTINNITESGFTKKQVEAIAKAFEDVEEHNLTRDTLRADIAESEGRMKDFSTNIEVRTYLFIFAALSPLYGKMFGFI